MNQNSTPIQPFSAPSVSGASIATQGHATRRDDVAEAEARAVEKLRALLREGRGSMMITVVPGSVQFWRVLPDGRSEIG